MKLQDSSLLRRSSPLTVVLDGPDRVSITSPLGVFEFGREVMPLLAMFAGEMSMGAAMERLQLANSREWEASAEVLRQMLESGVLLPGVGSLTESAGVGFGDPEVHCRMLADRTRTNAYIQALQTLVVPGEVVLDLGTGSGVLAAAAARAGARKVYAVEQGPAAEWAERVMRSNKLDSQVEVIRGWSESLSLPEPVDVVVSETLGNQPFEEGILASLADAGRRLTRPGARFIPSAIELLAFLVQTPDSVQEDYGLDLSCLSEWSEQAGQRRGLAEPQQVRDWTFLAQEVALARVQSPWDGVWEGETSLQIDQEGRVDAVVMAFRAELSPENTISTCPFEASRDCHWSNPVYWLAHPIEVRPGQILRLHWDLRRNAQAVRLEG